MMATDYDTPRKTDEELHEESLEELKARRADAQSGQVDIDEAEAAENLELPGADLSGEELTVGVGSFLSFISTLTPVVTQNLVALKHAGSALGPLIFRNSSFFKTVTFLIYLLSIFALPTYSQLLITTISRCDFCQL